MIIARFDHMSADQHLVRGVQIELLNGQVSCKECESRVVSDGTITPEKPDFTRWQVCQR
jgi:hypothetical protein